MRRLVVLAAAVTLALAVASADAASPGFRYGVAAGEITSTSAVLWTRAPRGGPVELSIVRPSVVARFGRSAAPCELERSHVRTRSRAHAGHELLLLVRAGRRRARSGRSRQRPQRPAATGPVRDLGRRRRDARLERQARRSTASRSTRAWPPSERLQHQPRRHDLLGQRGRGRGRRADRRGEVGEVQARPRASGAPQRLRASAGLYSHWDDHEFINDFSRAEHGEAIYDAGVKAFTDYAPVAYVRQRRPLPDGPLGQEPRALLPRRALLPQREGRRRLQRRPRPDRAAGGARRVRDPRAGAPQPRVAGVPRRAERPGADDARRAPVRGVHEGDQGVEGDVEGDRQRGARSSSTTRCRTTAGRATRPSASGSFASCRRT